MMKKIKGIYILLFLILMPASLFCTPVIRMETSQEQEMNVGDTFEVAIVLSDNDGAYSVFLDVRYNAAVFELKDIIAGNVFPLDTDSAEMLVAREPYNNGGRVIISQSLVGERPMLNTNGVLVKLVFKAINYAEESRIYLDSGNTLMYLDNLERKRVNIADLPLFTVRAPYTFFFIQITSPYNNYKSDTNQIDYHVQATIRNPNYRDRFQAGLKKVTHYSEHAPAVPGSNEVIVSLRDGQAFFRADAEGMFVLDPGYNYIVATLYVNNEPKAKTVKRVYYEVMHRGVRILDPPDNSITSQYRISVNGESTFENVAINNRNAITYKTGENTWAFKLDNFYLKEGFNKIQAMTRNPEAADIIYQDTVVVYYQRDESIFGFIQPEENMVFKQGSIALQGVIDTIDKEKVCVKMRAHFQPFNSMIDDYYYAFLSTDAGVPEITLDEFHNPGNTMLSHYAFSSSFDLSLLEGYGSGILTFYAVKVDKQHEQPDREVSRRVIIDRGKLEIDLRQPNLVSRQLLAKKSDLDMYNISADTDEHLVISDNACISLKKKDEPRVRTGAGLESGNIKEIIVTGNGTSYAIVNNTNRIELYKKEQTGMMFTGDVCQPYFQAYAHCAIEFGNNNLLIGTSDYNRGSGHPSGLILFNNGLLRTARLPFPVNEIQFIKKTGSDYYLYASNFTYMYQFNEADVVISQYDLDYFEIKNMKRYYLPTTLFITGFEVTNNGKTIVLGTELGVQIYRFIENGYSLVREFKKGFPVLSLAGAELENDYNVYAFAYEEDTGLPPGEQGNQPVPVFFSVITEKDGVFMETEWDVEYEELYALDSLKQNRFLLYGKPMEEPAPGITVIEVFHGVESATSLSLPPGIDCTGKDRICFRDNRNYILYGNGLLIVEEEYGEESGEIEFLISDPYVDGITGFSFCAPGMYGDLVTIKYLLTDDVTGGNGENALQHLLTPGEPVAGSDLSVYGYQTKKAYKYLTLYLCLNPAENGSYAPWISNLTIIKKEIVKTTAGTLEVKGFIHDETVRNGRGYLTINSKVQELGEFGAFYDTIPLDTEETGTRTPVSLHVENETGESDDITFYAEYVKNEPQIGDIVLIHSNGSEVPVATYDVDHENDYQPVITTGDRIGLSGNFSGLYGVQVTAHLYTLDQNNDIHQFIAPAYRAELTDITDTDGERSGRFVIDAIRVIPGTTRIVLKCTNPYGTSRDIKFDLDFQVKNEKVEITNYTVINSKLDTIFNVKKNSTGEYIKTFELKGRVITSGMVENINLRSDTPYITFTRGNDRDVSFTSVPLNSIDKSFNVFVNLNMIDDNQRLVERLKLWPASLQLNNLARFIYIEFQKEFNDIQPDFSPCRMDPDTGEIMVQFRFHESLPENMLLRLRFNHIDLPANSGAFTLKRKESSGDFLYEDGIYSFPDILEARNGLNILDWWLYQDKGEPGLSDTDHILSSGDLEFLYDNGEEYTPFSVVFPGANRVHNSESLQERPLQITSDIRGELTVILNNTPLAVERDPAEKSIDIDLTKTGNALKQGLNRIEVMYRLESRNIDHYEWAEFEYDSLSPSVRITLLDFNDDPAQPCIASVTAEIIEDNLNSVSLIYNGTTINRAPSIIITGENSFLYQWSGLESLLILPDENKGLYVEARDITGKKGQSQVINSGQYRYLDIQLSNSLADTKVLNAQGIQTGGTDDQVTDYRSYWNEQDPLFDYHLKYETTKLKDEQLRPLREEITDVFTKETIFNSDKKYLMFVLDNPAMSPDLDIAYTSRNTLTRGSLVTPVTMLKHKTLSFIQRMDTIPIGSIDGKKVYSVVEGYRIPDTYYERYTGYARDIKLYKNNALVIDWLDQNKDNRYSHYQDGDYRSIIIYALTESALNGIDDIIDGTQDELPIPDTGTIDNLIIPAIKLVLDDQIIRKATDIRIYDNYLYVLCREDGIVIYDLAKINKTTPAIEWASALSPGTDMEETGVVVHDVIKHDEYLFLSLGEDGIAVYDVIDITRPHYLYTIRNIDVAPVKMLLEDDICYTLSENNTITKYGIDGSGITEEESMPMEPGFDPCTSTFSRIWMDQGMLYVVPCENSFIQVHDPETLAFVKEITLKATNIPGRIYSSNFYPCRENIVYMNPATGIPEIIQGGQGGSLGIAVNGPVIYSASGEQGLKIIVADEGGEIDFINYPADPYFTVDSSGHAPVYHAGMAGEVEGVLELPFSLDSETSASNCSIYKIFDPPVLLGPSRNIKARFMITGDNIASSLFRIRLKFRQNGVLSECYYSGDVTQVASSSTHFLKVANGTWIDVVLSLEHFGITNADYLEEVEYTHMPMKIRGTGTYNERCFLDSVVLPDYLSFTLPLSHLAMKIDENPGAQGEMTAPMELIEKELFIPTRSGRAALHLDLREGDIEERFDYLSSTNEYEDDYVAAWYDKSYFTDDERKNRYLIGQCLDDQELGEETTVNLAKLNKQNADEFTQQMEYFFQRRDDEGITKFLMSNAQEDICLVNQPEPGTYKIYLTDTLVVEPPLDGEERITQKTSKYVRIPRNKSGGALSFWLRLEDEIPWFTDYPNREDFNTSDAKPVVSWGGENARDACYRFVIKPKGIAFVQYKAGSPVNKTDADIEPGNIISAAIDNSPSGSFYGNWHLFTLCWQGDGGLTLYVDDIRINPEPVHMKNFDPDRFYLEEKITFGDTGQDVSSFYYSIASPKVFNRQLNDYDVSTLYHAANKLQGGNADLEIGFNGNLSITKHTSCQDDITASNPVYEETLNGQGIVVTGGMENHISGNFPDKGLMLTDTFTPAALIMVNTTCLYDQAADTLTLALIDDNEQGIYHLTDGSSSAHGIPGAESFTFSGTIVTEGLSGDDRCIVKINGRETVFPLEHGDFQFTCLNTGEVLSSLDIYFDIRRDIVFKASGFGFNSGRYRGNNYTGYPHNVVRMRHMFYHKESVVLYFDPLFQDGWELNNREIVIIDSHLYTIGIHENRYYAVLKTRNGDIRLTPDTPLKGGLHQLAVIYDFSASVFSFYIDASLEAVYEGSRFVMPDCIGVFPDVYNITPGGNLDGTIMAEGIIDHLTIYQGVILEQELLNDAHAKTTILDVAGGPLFDRRNIELTLGNNTGKTLHIAYTFDDGESREITLNAHESTAIAGEFDIGNHILFMDIDTGEMMKKETYRFIVNYAPMIKLKNATPFIIRGNRDFFFEVERPDENMFNNQDNYIVLELYMSETEAGLDSSLVQTIAEDRSSANHGVYIRDDEPGIKRDDILFEVTCDLPMDAKRVFYRIKSYYFGAEENAYSISGKVNVLDITDPEIIAYDEATRRPWKIGTGIKEYDEQKERLNSLKCRYEIMRLNDEQEFTIIEEGLLSFNQEGKIIIDVYSYKEPGNYRIVFEPTDEMGGTGIVKQLSYSVSREETITEDTPPGQPYIDRLDLILIDKENSQVSYNLDCGVHGLGSGETYHIKAILKENGNTERVLLEEDAATETMQKIIKIPGLEIGESCVLTVTLTYKDIEKTKSAVFTYYGKIVNVTITHGPSGFIDYNNVFFNWEGELDGEATPDMYYHYSIDDSPWGYSSGNSIAFYNLEDGSHRFRIQAFDMTGNLASGIKSAFFIIDTEKPVIDESGILIKEIKDEQGIVTHLALEAAPGAVTDLSIAGIVVNGSPVEIHSGGGFSVDYIPLDIDGENQIEITAHDLLGNTTRLVKTYDYIVLEITYPPEIADLENPAPGEFVKYSPLTVYGKIAKDVVIPDGFTITAHDPFGKHEAVINFDRTFFIENVRINPGSEYKGIKTILTFQTGFGNGKTVYKKHPVLARSVIRPVELDLSVHAVPGGAETTLVVMKGFCRAEDIACWSFDYDGDGVYEDDIYTNENSVTREYRYSSVGVIHPRVRVITKDNHIFSGDDRLIIHDKIIKADVKDIPGALSIAIIEVDPDEPDYDGFEYVYILQQESNYYLVKRYMIEANNATLLYDSSLSINLSQMNIQYPRCIKADKNHDIYVSSLYGPGSRLFKLVPVTGGYRIDESFRVIFYDEIISSFDVDDRYVYISLEQSNELVKYTKDAAFIARMTPYMNNIIEDIQTDPGLDAENGKLWIGDYRNMRVVSVSGEDLSLRDFFGEPGNREGQFIYPKIVQVKGNYIFVMDQSEKTLQVFEQTGNEYRITCRVDNTSDYLTPGFLQYITDFSVFTKLEGKRRYYYAAMVNNYPGQVALLRIPQWQPDTVKVKSNLIVYVKNNEIFTSKPDGADARKIFSSGSLPGVDGNVDFPGLAPDGKTIVFVSRAERLEYIPDEERQAYRKYDKLYMIDVDGTTCTLVDDTLIHDKEIDRPQFSYNGRKIIFSAKGKNEFWTVYEYDRDKKTITRLFEPKADCLRPTYSPDDRYIAYVTRFYNHNEIVIHDSENPDRIIYLTSNDVPDDYPVWAPVYDGEIQSEIKGIKSKIAFVSKPEFKEKIYYIYIAQETSEDFRIVKANGDNTGNNPDAARNELENIDYEERGTISYPCFTSDGKTIIFESAKNAEEPELRQYNLETGTESPTGVPRGSRRPSGMKNRIVNFKAEVVEGNSLSLTWDRYALEELTYTVTYKSSEKDAEWAEESFTSQDHALIKGLDMGLTYSVRVYVKDLLKGGEVTTSVLKKVVVPPVVARPTVRIDENDPYKVRLFSWKPETEKPWEKEWKFRWYIDNMMIEETFNDFTEYIFSAAGEKRIALEASIDGDPAKVHRSEDVIIDIQGDLTPCIEYRIIQENDMFSIELDGSGSTGTRIDRNHFCWKISGYNMNNALSHITIQDEVTTVQSLDGFKGDITVTLTISGIPPIGAKETVREEKSITKPIALGFDEILPVIIASESDDNPGFFTFDGNSSQGNIDWISARWEIFGPADDLHPDGVYKRDQGVISTSCVLPERNEDTYYKVVLSARGKSSSTTKSAVKIIKAGKNPVVPTIDYKVITARSTSGAIGSAEETVTAKLLLNAASSRGSNIDWDNITWNLPLAGDYGGTSTQKGPSVIYNLYNVEKGMNVDVQLTIPRKGTGEIATVSEVITIQDGAVPDIVPYIELMKDEKRDLYDTAEADVYLFSALNSKGPNIDWNNVQWLIDGQYTRQGPIVRVDHTDSGEENQAIVVTLTLSSTAGGTPVTKTAEYNIKRKEIDIVISRKTKKAYLEAGERNMVILSVKDSVGQNIDWERTRWFIYQGPEDIINNLYGAEIVHTFPVSNDIEYYPVYVQMFFKGSTKPFVKNINVKVKGDRLLAIIKEEYTLDIKGADKYVRTFTAADSLGENIDWQNCKWTFGDSSEYQYGPVATHRFPYGRDNAYYTVTLTISRNTKDGKMEISTDTYVVNMAKDELNAKITVRQEGTYVVFSAEESEGRGLLLDRSMWLFEGADSENWGESESDSYSRTVGSSESFSYELGLGLDTVFEYQLGSGSGPYFRNSYGLGFNWNWGWNWSQQGSHTDSSQFSLSSGESSNNIYSGASCRKMIDGWLYKRVTLVVYRALPDGTIEAQSKSFIYTAGDSEVRIIE